jgi:hypothetical protein
MVKARLRPGLHERHRGTRERRAKVQLTGRLGVEKAEVRRPTPDALRRFLDNANVKS